MSLPRLESALKAAKYEGGELKHVFARDRAWEQIGDNAYALAECVIACETALQRFGQHTRRCACSLWTEDMEEPECDCGYRSALARVRQIEEGL